MGKFFNRPGEKKKIGYNALFGHSFISTMVIGIDASLYQSEEPTGTQWWTYHLLNHLFPLLGRDHHQQIVLYAEVDFVTVEELPFNIRKKILASKYLKKFWHGLRLSWEMVTHPPDLLFMPSAFLPFFAPARSIVTLHDLSFLHLKTGNFLRRFFLHIRTRRIVRKAYRLIVPNQTVQNDLLKFYHCPKKKIIIIPPGPAEIPKFRRWSFEQEQTFRRQFQMSERDLYIFCVGRLETRKNLVRLVQAFHQFLQDFPDWKLIMAGKRGFGFEKIWKTVTELGLEGKILMPGYVTEEEKAFLFEYCRIAAFPSLAEGFGSAILEAFAYAKPVLTSNRPPMPEVAGEGALLVDPEKVAAIYTGLKKLADDPIFSLQLGKKGQQQLKKFSWETSAEKVWTLLMPGEGDKFPAAR